MAKLPFMMGRYKWLVKVLSVGAECKGEDPSAERKKPTSTKEQHTTAVNGEKNEEHKVFNDPIHGHILLDPVLVKIINTPEFQRLRNINQLGGVYYVYPGASHNRFEHSIGVAHLAGELTRALKMKQEKRIKQLTEKLTIFQRICLSFGFTELGNLKKLEDLNKSLISDKDILCVQIAGLCHDLGHGPFSHLFDRMFMPEAIKRGEDQAGKEGKAGEESNGKKKEKWEHEDASIEMLRRLLDKTDGLKDMMKKRELKIEKGETEWTFIKELIKPKEDAAQHEWPYKEEKSFLYEIVSNKKTGIDVDKFDYFARDCHHLGIRNNFDHKRFIMFARVCDVEEEEDGSKKKKKIKHICSRDKEVANLYDIFQQRHSIHRRACKHRIALAVEIMIKDALVLADRAEHKAPELQIKGSNDKTYCLCKAKEDMEAYIKLTDQVIERIQYFPPSFKEAGKEDSSETTVKKEREEVNKKREEARKDLENARKILRRVMNRDLYFCVGQAMNSDQVEISKEMEESLKTMVKDISDDGEDGFVIIAVPLDYGKEGKDSKPYVYRKKQHVKAIPPSTSEKKDQVEISKAILQEMEKSLKTMIKDIPDDGEDEFVIIAVPLDYGKEGKDSKPYAYRKKQHVKAIPPSTSELKEKNKMKEEKLKEKERDLITKLATKFPGDGKDNFEVMLVTLDYGMKNVDPISKAYFYRKDNPDKGFPISKSKVSKFLPEHFSEDKFMVYWKNHDGRQGKEREEREKKFRECFKDWCKQNGFEDVEDDPASPETPGNDQSS